MNLIENQQNQSEYLAEETRMIINQYYSGKKTIEDITHWLNLVPEDERNKVIDKLLAEGISEAADYLPE